MKKYLVFLLLILVSCEKDLLEPMPDPTTHQMIFDVDGMLVSNGQEISFEIITNEQHQLIISTQEGSVITKEKFQPQLGINTRKIYTKTLPKENLNLVLQNEGGEVGSVSIIIE